MLSEVKAAKTTVRYVHDETESAANDIQIKKFNTSYGTYEPGKATLKEYPNIFKAEHNKGTEPVIIKNFTMYYCDCNSKNSADFSKNHPHDFKKIGRKKVKAGCYSSDDGKLTLWTSNGKAYFKVSSDNDIEHYRVVFRVDGLYYDYEGCRASSDEMENIDLYCISTDNADDYAIKPTISLDKEYLELHKDDTAKLTATTNVKNAKVKWTSSNNTVTVDQNGNVKAVSATGGSTITAEINVDGKKATAICNVTISLKTPNDSTAGDDKITTFNFKEDDYLKYTAKTKTTWNLRTGGTDPYSTKGSDIIYKIKKDDVVKVLSLPTKGKKVGVEVVTGDFNGTTGYIFFDSNAVNNFMKTTKPVDTKQPEEIVDDEDKDEVLDILEDDFVSDSSGTIDIDFGELSNGISQLIKTLLNFVIEAFENFDWQGVGDMVGQAATGLFTVISGLGN